MCWGGWGAEGSYGGGACGGAETSTTRGRPCRRRRGQPPLGHGPQGTTNGPRGGGGQTATPAKELARSEHPETPKPLGNSGIRGRYERPESDKTLSGHRCREDDRGPEPVRPSSAGPVGRAIACATWHSSAPQRCYPSWFNLDDVVQGLPIIARAKTKQRSRHAALNQPTNRSTKTGAR